MARVLCSGALLLASFLAGCAGTPSAGLLAPVAPASPPGRRIEVLVAASRLRGDNPHSFSHGRSHLVNYQAVELSVPPGRSNGTLVLPRSQPADPSREFAALANQPLGEADFDRRVAAAAKGNGNANVFIHGFNTTYEEAVFRVGQINADSDLKGAAILFTWPSRGRVLDYLTDRESATFSRDRLEIVLRQLARQPGVKQINILAHSMGSYLLMETLRQASLRGDGEFSGKLNAIGLAAPDIDLDVFRTQLEVIGKRKRPTIVLVSRDDQALSLSRTLSGDVERVGVADVSSPEARNEISRFGLTFLDLTAVKGTDSYNHGKFAAIPSVTQQFAGLVPGTAAAAAGSVVSLDAAGQVAVVADRNSGN